ncbi:hypothetical protein [Blastochloris tepida]|uniref:hypothetical protein n=1 Tax=Blastochloris tepida TaxID=2233851 RepID=UPI000F83152B|nr:hypothetical protein [Blastochloris tepida]
MPSRSACHLFAIAACVGSSLNLSTRDASALQVFECAPLEGKGVSIASDAPRWFEDSLGPVRIILDNGRFYVSVDSYVPPGMSSVIDGRNPIEEATVTSADDDHIIAVVIKRNAINVFNFHVKSRMIVHMNSHINNMAMPVVGEKYRATRSTVFVSHCR